MTRGRPAHDRLPGRPLPRLAAAAGIAAATLAWAWLCTWLAATVGMTS